MKKIYKPFELTSIKFFNENANFAEKELGVIWFNWNREYIMIFWHCVKNCLSI